MRTNQGIVAIIAIAFLATGCSGDKSAAAPVKEVCSLLSGDAVAKVTAKQVTSKPGPEQNAAANGGKDVHVGSSGLAGEVRISHRFLISPVQIRCKTSTPE